MSRRTIPVGPAMVAAGGIGGTGAQALALPSKGRSNFPSNSAVLPADDARLLAMSAALVPLLEADEAAWTALSRAGNSVETAALWPAAEAAGEAMRAAMRLFAAEPAVGLAGIAAKVSWGLLVLEGEWTDACGLPDAIRADLARLVPGLEAWT